MRKNVPKMYIDLIQYMHKDSITNVKSICGETDNLNVEVGMLSGFGITCSL